MGVEGKAYIVLYACSLSYAWYMDLVSSLETREFILSLKKLIARKGRPQKIYLDHGSIFEEGDVRWEAATSQPHFFTRLLIGNKYEQGLRTAPYIDMY